MPSMQVTIHEAQFVVYVDDETYMEYDSDMSTYVILKGMQSGRRIPFIHTILAPYNHYIIFPLASTGRH